MANPHNNNIINYDKSSSYIGSNSILFAETFFYMSLTRDFRKYQFTTTLRPKFVNVN